MSCGKLLLSNSGGCHCKELDLLFLVFCQDVCHMSELELLKTFCSCVCPFHDFAFFFFFIGKSFALLIVLKVMVSSLILFEYSYSDITG